MRSSALIGTTMTVTAAATAAILAGIGGIDAAGAAPALDARWYGATPYVMPLENDPPDLAQVMAATGQKSFQLAFILAAGNSCRPAWDGSAPVDSDTRVASVISTVRSHGGDVSVSIGGYGGTKLGQVCADPAATATAYQAVVDKYALRAIDFDLEEPEYENTAAVANELGAARILQQANPGLVVSVTMPATAQGTGYFGQLLLDEAHRTGFVPHDFSVMPFDGGFTGAAAQVSALEAFHGKLMSTFGWDSATAYAHEGVSLMNGRSDTGEYFRQADFQTVLDYALGHRLARYTFWSVNRDRQCTPADNQATSGTCSSVTQSSWDFTRFTARFAGATTPPPTTAPTTPPPTTRPPTTPPTTPPATSCPATWSPTTAYNGQSVVGYGGHRWTARWWTYGDVPGRNAQDVWVDSGAC